MGDFQTLFLFIIVFENPMSWSLIQCPIVFLLLFEHHIQIEFVLGGIPHVVKLLIP